MSTPDYIIGLGPPRGGTTSLAALLDGCDGATISHEGTRFTMPWQTEKDAAERAVEWLRSRDGRYVGDVGYYWLPYVLTTYRYLARKVRFIAVLRDQADWHESFSSRVDGEVLKRSGTPSRRQFPFIHRDTAKERRDVYYRRYVQALRQLRAEGLPLTILSTRSLNTPRRILRASGIRRQHWNATTHHRNAR